MLQVETDRHTDTHKQHAHKQSFIHTPPLASVSAHMSRVHFILSRRRLSWGLWWACVCLSSGSHSIDILLSPAVCYTLDGSVNFTGSSFLKEVLLFLKGKPVWFNRNPKAAFAKSEPWFSTSVWVFFRQMKTQQSHMGLRSSGWGTLYLTLTRLNSREWIILVIQTDPKDRTSINYVHKWWSQLL